MSAPPSGLVRFTNQIIVNGVGMQNVELLPATGYLPVYARFNFAPGELQATAYLSNLPRGVPTAVRVSAFDVRPGGTGREIVVMERTYTLVTRISEIPYQDPADLLALINNPANRTPANVQAAIDKHEPPDLRPTSTNPGGGFVPACINSGYTLWSACEVWVTQLIAIENSKPR